MQQPSLSSLTVAKIGHIKIKIICHEFKITMIKYCKIHKCSSFENILNLIFYKIAMKIQIFNFLQISEKDFKIELYLSNEP